MIEMKRGMPLEIVTINLSSNNLKYLFLRKNIYDDGDSDNESFSKTIEKKSKKSRSEIYSDKEKSNSRKINIYNFSDDDMNNFIAKQEEANERNLDYFEAYEDEEYHYDLEKKITKKKNNFRKDKTYSYDSNYSSKSNGNYNNFNKKDKSRDNSYSYNNKKERNNTNFKTDWRQPHSKDRNGMNYNKNMY